MEIVELDRKITKLSNIVHALYTRFVPDWQRELDARILAKTMAKKNRNKEKPAHHRIAGALMKMAPQCQKKSWRKKTQCRGAFPLRPKNTPEKANWDKMRRDVNVSISHFEAKIATVARKRAVEQLENLYI